MNFEHQYVVIGLAIRYEGLKLSAEPVAAVILVRVWHWPHKEIT